MRRLILGSTILLTAACSLLTGPGDGPPSLLDALPRELSDDEKALIDAGNQFTFDLFREATRELTPDSNALLSPLSASMALGMTLNGAGGTTLDSMRVALRVEGRALESINRGYQSLIALLTALDPTTEINIANSVWSHIMFPIRAEFVETARTWFDAEARSVDFDDPATLSLINGWVKEKTRNRIPELLKQIDFGEVAFLINAIYFKGQWRARFDPSDTRNRPFHGADATRDVPMMSRAGKVRLANRSDYQAVELLYGNGAFAMTILLPRQDLTPREVLDGLTPDSWRALTESFAEAELPLVLPKFKFDFARELEDPLSAMGMRIAFDGRVADLYGIADVRPERLFLTRVTQKAFIEVNEEGTEAAAATAVGVGATSVPQSVVVDRPFLFAIRERLSGTILFIGQVNSLK